jgi:hypothetical protein
VGGYQPMVAKASSRQRVGLQDQCAATAGAIEGRSCRVRPLVLILAVTVASLGAGSGVLASPAAAGAIQDDGA